MSDAYPYLLVVVEGPSEVRRGEHECRGAIVRLISQVFGAEVTAALETQYIRHIRPSPLRSRDGGPPRDLKNYALKAWIAARVGDATTAYGTVIVIDADGHGMARLDELQRGAEASGCRARVAVGVATEMLEAWLLADPGLLSQALPAGKRAEDLWGDKHDGDSNYPTHVLRRCVLDPKRWMFQDAVEPWSPAAARLQAPSLEAFLAELEALARSQGVQ